MKLFYIDSESRKLIFESNDEKEINKKMMEYIRDILHFKSYYQRSWKVPPDETYIDYGSYTCFFVIKE